MGHDMHRRDFLGAAGATAVALTAARIAAAQGAGAHAAGATGAPPVVISSGNGLAAVRRAREVLEGGGDPLDAIVEGVRIVEDDPEDMTVGLGGLPNEEGVVELDSSCMHGPTHRAGAVAALRNIRNPASVAREVARRTDHVLIVGEGALKFARRMGFVEENLLTEKARLEWVKWRASLSRDDDWLDRDEWDIPPREGAGAQSRAADNVAFTYGTIHCSALTAGRDLAGVTTTSGLSWKLPGRVGDSPIIGAGLYTDNDVGSAGATGRGEAVIQICGAHTIVSRMEAGDHPTQACLFALRKIASRTRPRRLLDANGRPNFNVVFYAVRKDGAYGSAAMRKGVQFAVSEGGRDRLEACAALYDD